MEKKSFYRDAGTIRYQNAVKKLSHFLKKYFCPLFLAFSVLCLINFDIESWNGLYKDCDGYMRAVRIYNWLLNPSFFEQPIYQSNYPFGEINHWTRPMDLIWLLNMLPFLSSFSLKEAVFLGGIFISPWLLILSFLALFYGLRRQFNIYLSIIGIFLFISNPVITGYYELGKPDHHSLMSLLSVYALSLIMCWLKKRHLRYLRLLGITLALMTFTAIEGFIIYSLIIAYYLFLYIFKNNSLMPTAEISKYFMISLTFFWLINPPYAGYFTIDNGRLSIVYVVLSVLLTLTFYLLNYFRLHTRKIKLASLTFAALAISAGLYLIFGADIYHFPLDNQIQSIWAHRITEMHKLWELSVTQIITIYPFQLISLILAGYLSFKKTYNRLMYLTLILGIPLFVLNILAIRFCNYQVLYTILPWLCLIDYLYHHKTQKNIEVSEIQNQLSLISLGMILLPQLLALPDNLNTQQSASNTYYSQLVQNVKKIGGTLVTDEFLSPFYMWNADVNTIATAYHRNRNGLIDNHNILFGENNREIIALLLKHQVTQILLFNKYSDNYDLSSENQNKLYYRLIKRENIPDYLEEIPNADKNTRHYRVKI